MSNNKNIVSIIISFMFGVVCTGVVLLIDKAKLIEKTSGEKMHIFGIATEIAQDNIKLEKRIKELEEEAK